MVNFVLEKPQQRKPVGARSVPEINYSQQISGAEQRSKKNTGEHAENVGKERCRKETVSNVNGMWSQPRFQQSVSMLTPLG